MQTRVVDRIETGLAQDFLYLDLLPIANQNTCPDRAAVRLCSNQFNFEPMIRTAHIVAQQRRRFVEIDHQNIQVSIIVEVAERASTATVVRSNAGSSFFLQLFKSPIP